MILITELIKLSYLILSFHLLFYLILSNLVFLCLLAFFPYFYSYIILLLSVSTFLYHLLQCTCLYHLPHSSFLYYLPQTLKVTNASDTIYFILSFFSYVVLLLSSFTFFYPQTLKVTNTSDTKVAFKVKTTQPSWYYVRPNQHILDVGQTEEVTITLVDSECA